MTLEPGSQPGTFKIPQHNTPRGTWCRFSGCDSYSGACPMCKPDEPAPRAESELCCTVYDVQCICRATCPGCRCRCKGCSCGPLVRDPGRR